MGKTSSAVKNRYNEKAYDRISLMIPKGRKRTIEAYAKEHAQSVNGLVNDLLCGALGFSKDEWKQTEERE